MAKVPRTIAKLPSFRSKSPKYCLLVFGPEKKTRVWMVLDEDRLYVDRNGNGDLTEKGEHIEAQNSQTQTGPYSWFFVGDIRDGRRRHTDLQVMQLPVASDAVTAGTLQANKLLQQQAKATLYAIWIKVAPHGRPPGATLIEHTALVDSRGCLQFADLPQDAPIIHFDGPLTMDMPGTRQLVAGRVEELTVGIGTAGLGPGTFAFSSYQGVIPEQAHPVVECEYPRRAPDKPQIRAKTTLTKRC